MEELFKQLSTQGILGLAFVLAIIIFWGIKTIGKFIERKSEKEKKDVSIELIENISKSLGAILIHIEQSQKTNERFEQNFSQLNNSVVMMAGVVENQSINVSKLIDSCYAMKEAIVVMNALRGDGKA